MSIALGERDGPCHFDMLHRLESETATSRHWTVSEAISKAKPSAKGSRLKYEPVCAQLRCHDALDVQSCGTTLLAYISIVTETTWT
jgi:hypothetical protein